MMSMSTSEIKDKLLQLEGMTEEKIAVLCEDKINMIGKELLTVEGAMFLVAYDLNVQVKTTEDELQDVSKIKDLYGGGSGVRIQGVVRGCSKPKQVTIKDGKNAGNKVWLRSCTIHDDTGLVKCVWWGDAAKDDNDVWSYIRTGNTVDISNCNTKSDYTGITVNCNDYTRVELLDEGVITTQEPADIANEVGNVVKGVLFGVPNVIRYGDDGEALSLQVRSRTGGDAVNCIMWGGNLHMLRGCIQDGADVVLYGVQRNNQGIVVSDAGGVSIASVPCDDVVLHVTSVRNDDVGGDHITCVDDNGVTWWVTTEGKLTELQVGSKIEATPVTVLRETNQMVISACMITEPDKNRPATPISKINEMDMESAGPAHVEVAVIGPPETKTIKTKKGKEKTITKILVCDISGPETLQMWGDISKEILGKMIPGHKYTVYGVSAAPDNQGQIRLTVHETYGISKNINSTLDL